MIITRTPLRVSFAGGMSDLPAWYYDMGETGAVVSAAISAFVYVAVNAQFDPDLLRLSYSVTENVHDRSELKHELIRECLYVMGVETGIEINTIADVPGRGAGLGSSASVTVGTLLALAAHRGWETPPPSDLASISINIEMCRLKKATGKQDQYAVAFGGINEFNFHASGVVSRYPVTVSDETLEKMRNELVLFHTGIGRSAGAILKALDMKAHRTEMKQIVGLCLQARDALESGAVADLGAIMDIGWQIKRGLSHRITMPEIDEMYEKAIDAGATGGRLLGAGGGGFLLLHVPESRQEHVAQVIKRTPVKVEWGVQGATIIYSGGE